MSNLLLDENPLVIIPSLAVKIGLNEAIFLQQLHYWILRSNNKHEEKQWVYKTNKEWQIELPFFKEKTIERIVSKLKDKKILIVEKLSSNKRNRVNYYTIDYEVLNNIKNENNGSETEDRPDGSNFDPCRQNNGMDTDNLSVCNIVKSLTETTPKTTKENIKNIKKVSEELSEGEQIIKALEIQHKKLNPNFEIKARGKSVIEASRLVKLDNYEINVVISVIDWIFNSKKGNFWIANIQSGQKLRDKFQQLFVQFKADNHALKEVEYKDFVPPVVSEEF